jgi:hypothetical protein
MTDLLIYEDKIQLDVLDQLINDSIVEEVYELSIVLKHFKENGLYVTEKESQMTSLLKIEKYLKEYLEEHPIEIETLEDLTNVLSQRNLRIIKNKTYTLDYIKDERIKELFLKLKDEFLQKNN